MVQFCWGLAHVDILGSQQLDQLAKGGSLKQITNEDIPHSDYILGIRETIESTRQFT